MGVLKPQPKTRQRALLAEWGIAESMVFEDGIDEDGIDVWGTVDLNDWETGVIRTTHPGVVRKTLAYPSREHHDRMIQAKADDWAEYVASLNIADPLGWLDPPPKRGTRA